MTVNSKQVITKSPANSDEAQSLGLTTTDITAGLCGYDNSSSDIARVPGSLPLV